MKEQTTLEIRRTVRRIANASRPNVPVCIVPGTQAPREVGESYHYQTRGGRRIYHPSAYAKRGWSNMLYISSDIRVEVGADYLAGLAMMAASVSATVPASSNYNGGVK